MNKVYLCGTQRSLLMFLLINNFLTDNVIYIGTNKDFCLDFLPGRKIFLREFDDINQRDNFDKILKRNLLIYKFRKKYKKLLKEIEKEKVMMYGLDHGFLAVELFYREKLILLEDGVANYTFFDLERKQLLKNKIKIFFKKLILYFIKIVFGLNFRKGIFGTDKSIKRIYLTGISTIPNEVKNKTQIINLKKLWELKTKEEKKIILKTFKVNIENFKNIKEVIILITQPLSEDGIISEKEKVDIYSKILKKYPKEKILIKCHPRETTNYEVFFPEYKVLKDKYPVEILDLIGVDIKKVVTLFSTAVFEFKREVKVDFYGTEVDKKIFKKFGTQDNIMKRNSFL